MKPLFISLLFCLFSASFFAQDNDNVFLNENFEKGIIYYKDGALPSLELLNYDLVEQKMVYKSEGMLFHLAYPNAVSSVKLGGRTFVQVKGDTFYERIKLEGIDLYIQWRSSIFSKGKKGAMGVRTQGGGIDNVAHVIADGKLYNLKDTEEFTLTSKNSYYLKINKSYKKITSVDSLAKLFKGHEDEIKIYAKEYNLNFNKLDDLKKIIGYCARFLEKE